MVRRIRRNYMRTIERAYSRNELRYNVSKMARRILRHLRLIIKHRKLIIRNTFGAHLLEEIKNASDKASDIVDVSKDAEEGSIDAAKHNLKEEFMDMADRLERIKNMI